MGPVAGRPTEVIFRTAISGNSLRLPAEQPRDDGAKELARRAAAIIEAAGMTLFYAVRDQRTSVSPRHPAAKTSLGRKQTAPVDAHGFPDVRERDCRQLSKG